MIRCIHVTPELPPRVGGVADYTALLSRRLVEVSDGNVEPVLVHAGNQTAETIEVDFPVVDLSGACSASILAETVEKLIAEGEKATVLLLEYSGYGYARNGAPRWLANGLRRVGRSKEVSLITIFHELYSTGYRPWKRSFWTMPLQRHVTLRLARLSAGMISNRRDTARWLRRHGEGAPVRMAPSFSNVGEPDWPEYESREAYAVSFGGTEKKAELYETWGPALTQALRGGQVERIVDVGPPVPEGRRTRVDIPIEMKGILPSEDVSSLLRSASLGLLNYPLHCLTKSGIWASYAAHGVPTLLAASPHTIEELDHGRHFLLLKEGRSVPGPARLEEISTSVYEWYRETAQSRRTAHRIMTLVSESA
jgi:hypothetical protein